MPAVLLPALGPEDVGIRAPEVLASVHRVNAVGHQAALGYEDGGLSVGPTAYGKGCVLDGDAEVQRDGWQ